MQRFYSLAKIDTLSVSVPTCTKSVIGQWSSELRWAKQTLQDWGEEYVTLPVLIIQPTFEELDEKKMLEEMT